MGAADAERERRKAEEMQGRGEGRALEDCHKQGR